LVRLRARYLPGALLRYVSDRHLLSAFFPENPPDIHGRGPFYAEAINSTEGHAPLPLGAASKSREGGGFPSF
jgi:hypothetical protein